MAVEGPTAVCDSALRRPSTGLLLLPYYYLVPMGENTELYLTSIEQSHLGRTTFVHPMCAPNTSLVSPLVCINRPKYAIIAHARAIVIMRFFTGSAVPE